MKRDWKIEGKKIWPVRNKVIYIPTCILTHAHTDKDRWYKYIDVNKDTDKMSKRNREQVNI